MTKGEEVNAAILLECGKALELLKAAKCPDCGGSGVILLTSTFETVEESQPLSDIKQCQWCEEGNELLNKN